MATIALVVGAGLLAAGQIEEGRAARAQGKAEQKIAEFNAVQKEREARSRMKAAELEEERVSKKAKIFKAEQRARLTKGGISITEGSSLDFLAETAGEFITERALTLRQGMVESGQLKSQASILRAGGQVSNQLGRSAQTASFFKAGATILSTASSLRTPKPLTPKPLTPNINTKFTGSAFKPGVAGRVGGR